MLTRWPFTSYCPPELSVQFGTQLNLQPSQPPTGPQQQSPYSLLALWIRLWLVEPILSLQPLDYSRASRTRLYSKKEAAGSVLTMSTSL